MIADNAIGYAQDRNSREWTFYYYLDNARHRLQELGKHSPELLEGLEPKKGKRNGKNRWTHMQAAFARAVRLFADEIKRDYPEISD
jgi:hypothetical protein